MRIANNYELPPDYTPTLQVDPEAMDRLLNDTAAVADPGEQGEYSHGGDFETGAPIGEYEAANRFCLGVLDEHSELVAYIAATIQEGGLHAEVDTIVVKKWERDASIGKALAVLAIRGLDAEGVKSISFQPYGEIYKLLPFLIDRHGFKYNENGHEYISKRERVTWQAPIMEPVAKAHEASESAGTDNEIINETEVTVLRDAISGLIRRTADHLNSIEPGSVSTHGDFHFEIAGRDVTLSREINRTTHTETWRLTDTSDELIMTPQGNEISQIREYVVEQNGQGRAHPLFDEVFAGDDLGSGLPPSVRPPDYIYDFTKGRYKTAMKLLLSLSPEHVQSFTEEFPVSE